MIFYFSATGNSKFIAERIAEASGESLINISECVQKEEYSFVLTEEEILGFVVPVYFWGLPIIVAEFLKKLKVSSRQIIYSYAVLNCGSATGNAEKLFSSTFSVSALFGIATVDNYMALYKEPRKTEIAKQLEKAVIVIDDAIAHIKNRDTGNFNKVQGIFPHLFTLFGHPLYTKGRKTKKFTVNQDCTHCGLCEKNCPRKVIRLKDGEPTWIIPQCELCLACLHRCPAKAIIYGKQGAHQGHYINPMMNIYNMISNANDKIEKS
jgi:NAD-dependent dihydropyrimidine dehydrogenase PreA subunit/flavodoxin